MVKNVIWKKRKVKQLKMTKRTNYQNGVFQNTSLSKNCLM